MTVPILELMVTSTRDCFHITVPELLTMCILTVGNTTTVSRVVIKTNNNVVCSVGGIESSIHDD